MWPFSGKRIFGSRWWAIAFVIFVCWQVSVFTAQQNEYTIPINAQDAQKLTDAINAM